MSKIENDGVYLITSVSHPNDFLINGPDPINQVSASSKAVQCWRLKKHSTTNRWTIRAIPTLYKGHVNFTGESGFYLAVGNEAQKVTVISDQETWHTLTETANADGTFQYRVANNVESLWLTISYGGAQQDIYGVNDWTKHEDARQTWKFQKMP